MAAAFSRLQLAAALLEYDNDPSDPYCEIRSANDSAIFAQFRRHARPRSVMSRKSTDYLGVSLPSEKASPGGRESVLMDSGDGRRSRTSIDMLRNPFGAAEEDLQDEEHLEVDLESWGLDGLLSKDKGKEAQKKPKLPNPYPSLSAQEPHRPVVGTRTMSMGNMDDFGVGGAFLDAKSALTLPLLPHQNHLVRRRADSTPIDRTGMRFSESLPRERRLSSHALIENMPVTPPLHSVPFPSSSRSTAILDEPSEGRPQVGPHSHQRTYSTISIGSRLFLNDEQEVLPPTGRRSRFDSQGHVIRTTSTAAPSTTSFEENNPFALRPPSPSRSSRFDPKAIAHARTMSNASLGSKLYFDDADMENRNSSHPREHYHSRLDLLRPKVLVMPSPLQNTKNNEQEPQERDGFRITSDGFPLPAGARSVSKSVSLMSPYPEGLVPSNSFTPNPRTSLSLAQLTFRGTLYGDRRDPGYSDVEGGVHRAQEEGEQVEHPVSPTEADGPVIDVQVENRNSKVPGKLYGRSLIDNLELRKAEMRGKRRVFQGDERPSMMARSSTLIDPSSLTRSGSQHLENNASKTHLTRRRTLLNLDENDQNGANPSRRSQLVLDPRASKVKTVFGVDTLWEREMAKLREMEALERKKAGISDPAPQEDSLTSTVDKQKEPSMPSPAPTSTVFGHPLVNRGPPPKITDHVDDDDNSDSDVSVAHKQSRRKQKDDGDWFSDEESAGPVRTVGSGPRYPKGKGRFAPNSLPQVGGDDSEEDIPLAATLDRVVQRATRLAVDDGDSDEDKPLTTLLNKTKLKLPRMSFEKSHSAEDAEDDGDDDDKPLGLKANRSRIEGDEDDRPLAFHPEQQRRTQYQLVAQQQHIVQQQIMMQAQLQNSLMFGAPSMMGTGFFPGAMVPPPMMAAQIPISMTPPVQDVNNFGRVDRWRHDVAVEGEP